MAPTAAALPAFTGVCPGVTPGGGDADPNGSSGGETRTVVESGDVLGADEADDDLADDGTAAAATPDLAVLVVPSTRAALDASFNCW